ncbi:HlyD family efflux transporter periplasmic adaptor subunit [Terrarubrum flagellatum]|uniref:HlyD family efflux transporter periplasmic adaptor subunit n=1 Tax=Terrirubrum flagellatum TaxID=2895980 RepID=UPI00314507E6
MAQPKVEKTGIILEAPNAGAAQETARGEVSAERNPSRDGPNALKDLHRQLGDAFGAPAEAPGEEDGAAAQDAPKAQPAAKPGFWTLAVRRPLKIAVALALIAVFGARPLQTLLQAASVEAVVNSRIVTIRAPIDGEIVAAPTDFTAWSAVKGAPALHIVDAKADRSRLDELRRIAGRLEDERPGLVERLAQTQTRLAALDEQTKQFQAGRIRQLEARIAALNSDLAGATARASEARFAEQRVANMTRPGVVSAAEAARVARDRQVADAAETAAKRRVEEATVELTAARQGSFIGDSYNDRPSSAQRADEMRQRIDDLNADLRRLDAQIARARADETDEAARFKKLSDVEVALPASGRVWEIMTAPGEHIRRGQDLIRLLDCSTAVVTANVAETVYNKLRIGGPAKFRPSDESQDYDGVIVNLTGVSATPANFAIEPKALIKEAYHVTVSVPKLASDGACGIGRTGRVLFDRAAPDAAAESLAFGLRR